jgi:hypothetical protein
MENIYKLGLEIIILGYLILLIIIFFGKKNIK